TTPDKVPGAKSPLPETVTTPDKVPGAKSPIPETVTTPDKVPGAIKLGEGFLTAEQIDLMLKNLPIDVSFVDEYDRVLYYSDNPERIFPRSPGVIGRNVANCHPPKSVHIVQRIVQAFRKKEKKVAEFWLELGGKFVHIRYFPVYDSQGKYRGTLEVSQDVSGIRALQGHRRLLDWD
ncbi:PAS domain-containing protein, partial [Gracilinema caldarium]|uniref:PAS domain-containing protein n=1 Tax=Gracilinema caldarium TaxID=215591 RepID=UPI0026EEB4CD